MKKRRGHQQSMIRKSPVNIAIHFNDFAAERAKEVNPDLSPHSVPSINDKCPPALAP